MFNIIKLLALSAFFVSNLHAMQVRGKTTQQRPLLIFLDESELAATQRSLQSLRVEVYGSGPGALSQDLQGALSQQAGPIIASKSLFANIMGKEKNYDAEWLIMEINEALLFLVHDKYLAQLGVNKTALISDDVASKEHVYLAEKIMGLKLTSFRPILSSSIKKEVRASDFCDYFADSLDDIFLKNSQYPNQRAPRWSMYMIGHGEASKRFIGMRLESFKRVLSFFDREINLDVLSYLSCFSGGMNQKIVYGESIFSFPVISQVLTDNVGHVLYNMKQKNFDLFTAAVVNNENGTMAVRHIIPLSPPIPSRVSKGFAQDSRWSDVPSIIEAGHDHFHVMVGSDVLMPIGGPKNSAIFDEQAFVANKPKGLLLFVNELPFEIKIDDQAFEVIISMVPGSAIHHIKRVSSDSKSIADILRTFMKIDPSDASSFGVSKSYYIEDIIDGQDNMVTDVIVAIQNNSWRAYFKQDGAWHELGDVSHQRQPELVRSPYKEQELNNTLSRTKSQLGQGLWSRASFSPQPQSFGHGRVEELFASLQSKTAFFIRNKSRTKDIIKEIDPNIVLDGRALISWVLERYPVAKGFFELDKEWVFRRDEAERKFTGKQEFLLDLINIMAIRGLDLTTNRDLVKHAILNRFSVNIVRRLIELGAPFDANDKFDNNWWHRGKAPLLYWVVDREGLWDDGAFQKRVKNDFLLMKLLIERKASCNGDDIMRHALFSRHSEEVIQYLLSNVDVLVDEYHQGILELAYDRGYSLSILKELCKKGARMDWLRGQRNPRYWDVDENGKPKSDEGDQRLAPLDDLLFKIK